MSFTKTFNKFLALLLACVVLAACASRPELISKSAVVPAGIDLSGQWRLRAGSGSTPPPAAGGELTIRIPPKDSRANTGRRPPGGSSGRSSGSAVHVFLETGDSLKISQTAHGLFISFDRAVVEEYTFGENRVVSIGPIEAQRVSGWLEGAFVVETMDAQGSVLTESWRLHEGGNVLVREISVTKNDREQFSSQQRFDRS